VVVGIWGWFRGCRQSRTGGGPGGRGEMEKGDREWKEVLWVVGRGETADGGGVGWSGSWGVVSRVPPVADWRGAWGKRGDGEGR